jgi:hypothetical protein
MPALFYFYRNPQILLHFKTIIIFCQYASACQNFYKIPKVLGASQMSLSPEEDESTKEETPFMFTVMF